MALGAEETLLVRVDSDISDLEQGLKAGTTKIKNFGKATDRTTRSTKKSARANKDAAGSLLAVAKGFIALQAGQAAVRFIGDIANEASDAEETMNLFRETFGDLSAETEAWADTTASAVSRSEVEIKKMAAQMQSLLLPMTGNRKEAAKMSKNMTQLAVDLASFFNITDQEALTKLRSGLSGEAEPLKQLGVAMNQASLEAFAMANGIDKSITEMSEAEKVTLRYKFILDKTTAAQGDAERTSDSYANTMRQFQGTVKDVKVTLGSALLPTLKSMTEAVGTGIEFWDDLIKKMKETPGEDVKMPGASEDERKELKQTREEINKLETALKSTKAVATGQVEDPNWFVKLVAGDISAEENAAAADRILEKLQKLRRSEKFLVQAIEERSAAQKEGRDEMERNADAARDNANATDEAVAAEQRLQQEVTFTTEAYLNFMFAQGERMRLQRQQADERERQHQEEVARLREEEEQMRKLQRTQFMVADAVGLIAEASVEGGQATEDAWKSVGMTMIDVIEDAVIKSITARAAEAAAGAAASQSAIPVVGPILATAAASAMFGFVRGYLNSFHTGTDFVSRGDLVRTPGMAPDEGLAVLQEGEQVVPRGDSGGTGTTVIHFHDSAFMPKNRAQQRRYWRDVVQPIQNQVGG